MEVNNHQLNFGCKREYPKHLRPRQGSQGTYFFGTLGKHHSMPFTIRQGRDQGHGQDVISKKFSVLITATVLSSQSWLKMRDLRAKMH